jgi:hypothetical protein
MDLLFSILFKNNVGMDRPYHPADLSANLGRDWPDARGIWLNDDKTLGAYLNRKDHVLLTCTLTVKDSDFQSVFGKFAQYVQDVRTFFLFIIVLACGSIWFLGRLQKDYYFKENV